MVAPVGGTKVEKSGGVRASSPKNIGLLEVTGEGVQLFEKPANNPKDKFAKGTILEQKRLSSDKKWILVKVQGKNDEGWISASQVRSKETPKPSVAKEPAKTVPQASPIAAPVPAASTETPLQILLKSQDGKAKLREIVAGMFSVNGLHDDEIGKLNKYIDGLVDDLSKNPPTIPTYQEVDKATTFQRKGLWGLDFTKGDVHCYRGNTGAFDINEIITAYSAKADAVAQAKAFMGLFVQKLTDKQSAYAKDEVITREEAGKLEISPALFDLIDSGMVTGIKGDGKISIDEIKRFNEPIDKYVAAFPITRDKAIELYRTAPSFEMQDLDKVIKTATSIENGGLGVNITVGTTFKDLQANLRPEVFGVIRAKYTGDKVGNNVKSLCQLLAALPLISLMDTKTQKDIFGIDAAKTPLQRYEGEANQENILSYVTGKNKEEAKVAKANPDDKSSKTEKGDAAAKTEQVAKVKSTEKIIADEKAKPIYEKLKDKLKDLKSTYSLSENAELSSLEKWAKAKGQTGVNALLGAEAYKLISPNG